MVDQWRLISSFPRENLYGLGDASNIVGSSRRRLVSAGRRRRHSLSEPARTRVTTTLNGRQTSLAAPAGGQTSHG
jgi:hypothetical protein